MDAYLAARLFPAAGKEEQEMARTGSERRSSNNVIAHDIPP
jgi:hypothetical protein